MSAPPPDQPATAIEPYAWPWRRIQACGGSGGESRPRDAGKGRGGEGEPARGKKGGRGGAGGTLEAVSDPQAP